MPFVSRTRATLRRAEFGFLGVIVITRVQTPRFCGAPRSAGVFVFDFWTERPLRTSWLTVGMNSLQRFPDTTKAGGAGPCQPEEDGSKDPRAVKRAEPASFHAFGQVQAVSRPAAFAF